MTATAPENSVQTIGRLAWTGAKIAYGGAVAYHIFSESVRKPEMSDEMLSLMGQLAEVRHRETLDQTTELRQYIDASLKLKPGEDCYAESAENIVEGLKILAAVEFHHDFYGQPLDPSKRADLTRIAAWATEMLPIWNKLRVVRLRQQKIIQDEYLIKMGAKSRFWVWYEELDFQYDRAFKYFLRSLIVAIVLSMMIGALFGKEAMQGFIEFGGAPMGWLFIDLPVAAWEIIKKVAIWFFFLGMD